jgi:hypothetical protein
MATEAQHQSAIFKWSQLVRTKYPELKLLHAIPNGGRRDRIEGWHLKQQGVKPGVPDLHLPVARHGFHSLYIELKTEKGRTSPEQDWWVNELAKQGNCVRICHGWTVAVETIEWYLAGVDKQESKLEAKV